MSKQKFEVARFVTSRYTKVFEAENEREAEEQADLEDDLDDWIPDNEYYEDEQHIRKVE